MVNKNFFTETSKALDNFIDTGECLFDELTVAMLEIKKAAATANRNAGILTQPKNDAIHRSVDLLLSDAELRKVKLDALSGGAGTSFNMNINELIEFTAYDKFKVRLNALDDINKSQSTNDVFPTAVKMAVLRLLKKLEESCAHLQKKLQEKETAFREIIMVGRTEWQDAVLLTLGQQFGAWAEAISRDRWRLYKCNERIRTVNIGGTAIGTGLNAPEIYINSIIAELRNISALNIVKAENLIDMTQNCDVFVEISGLLKSNAASLKKICSDIRFMSCGPDAGIAELKIPAMQKGSTIMPGKVNPVILENIIQSSMLVFGLDNVLANAAADGHLQLNPYMPLIAYCIIKELKILIQCGVMLADKVVNGIEPQMSKIDSSIYNSCALFTALAPFVKYAKIEELVNEYEKLKMQGVKIKADKFLLNKKILSAAGLKKLKENIIK